LPRGNEHEDVFTTALNLTFSPGRRNSKRELLVLWRALRQIQSQVLQRGGGCFSLSANGVVRGVISMARSNDPNSAGSQFFICHGNPTFLDNQYAIFGKLIQGDDVLEKIGTTPTHPQDRPDKWIGIESIKVVPANAEI
jgi:cyclophilin family peptidyl-prolyl cis-trans isomerase